MTNECDHRYVRDGEVRRSLNGIGSYQMWARYFCERCLAPRFALIKEYNAYTGTTEHKDGTRIVESMESLP